MITKWAMHVVDISYPTMPDAHQADEGPRTTRGMLATIRPRTTAGNGGMGTNKAGNIARSSNGSAVDGWRPRLW